MDEMLQRQTHAGQLAFELERNEEAAAQYRTALSRAQARDDPDAIGDTGYNLAVAELRANAPDKALADARATRIELERRDSKPFPALRWPRSPLSTGQGRRPKPIGRHSVFKRARMPTRLRGPRFCAA
jgi:hypothetical protein